MELTCPHYGELHTHHDGPTPEAKPVDGDVSICWACRSLSLYADTDHGLVLREPTNDEAERLADDPEIKRTLGVMAEVHNAFQARELRWGQR